MNKKVLVISGSPRKNGNSDQLCKAFIEGVKTAGHSFEKISVREKQIGYCLACYACRESHQCFQNDDMQEILKKIIAADVLVLASPVYFYSINAQMKALIDRTLARWLEIKNKEVYYIVTAAEDNAAVMERAVECFRGFADCFAGMQEKGVIYAHGVYEKGAVAQTDYLEKAKNMGERV